ncbi:sulfurtransferase [Mycobacterium sp. BMJ-28]
MTSNSNRAAVLITADELHRRVAKNSPVLLDVRWALGRTDGREEHRRAHLPGGVYVDLERELAAPPSPEHGRHPLPDIGDLQESARRWGINDGDDVVIYDAGPATSAARAWWLLRWAGLATVRILDGGLAEWTRRGLPTESGPTTVPPGSVTLAAGHLATVDADGAAHSAGASQLLDARAPERYRGDTEPVDPRAGHIPGARNLPTSSLLDESGRFLADEQLRAAVTQHGHTPAVHPTVYCGSGITAAHVIAGLAITGIDAALYPGSWSQWSNDARREIETSR